MTPDQELVELWDDDEDRDWWDTADHDYPSYFAGCTCEHDPEDHTWGSCNECEECEGGWEE